MFCKTGKAGCCRLAVPGNESNHASSFGGIFVLACNPAGYPRGGRTDVLSQPSGENPVGDILPGRTCWGVGWSFLLKVTLVLFRFIFVWGDFVGLFLVLEHLVF